MKILQVINAFPPAWGTGGPARAAYEISKELVKRGAKIQAYDPKAMGEASAHYLKGIESVSYVNSKYEALQHADAMVLLTEWKEFRSPDFSAIKKLLKTAVIFDGRNQYNIFNLAEKGFEYYQIGRAKR